MKRKLRWCIHMGFFFKARRKHTHTHAKHTEAASFKAPYSVLLCPAHIHCALSSVAALYLLIALLPQKVHFIWGLKSPSGLSMPRLEKKSTAE